MYAQSSLKETIRKKRGSDSRTSRKVHAKNKIPPKMERIPKKNQKTNLNYLNFFQIGYLKQNCPPTKKLFQHLEVHLSAVTQKEFS